MRRITSLLSILCLSVVVASCGDSTDFADTIPHRSVYFWKTTFEIGPWEKSFLEENDIDRIYLRMFDVDVQEDYATDTLNVIPVGTCSFKSPKPDSVEIVPTVFITVRALEQYKKREAELADLISERVLNMCSYNDLEPVREVQVDCDWTASTRESFDAFCEQMKVILHEKGIALSGTIRLHQVEEAKYPFDKGVLMLYNTGAIKNRDTENSILSCDDVKKYLGVQSRVDKFLKARRRNCKRVDFAYPTFDWNVVFDEEGNFLGLSNDPLLDYNTREERSEYPEIMKVKDLVTSTLGAEGSNIIFHLDSANLSKYSEEEIKKILQN